MTGLFRDLLPAEVRVAEVDPRTVDPAVLHPEEWAQVARAVPSRQREYAAGRFLARQLGVAGPLLNGEDRAPRWPAGIVGSITHCASWAAVAVTEADVLLGIDVELRGPLPPGVAELVLRHEERNLDPLVVFSAKESVYKAVYRRLQRFVDFQEVRIELRGAEIVASAAFGELRGRWVRTREHVATAVCQVLSDP